MYSIPSEYLFSEEEPYSYTRDFRAKFSSLIPGENDLVETLELYLKEIEKILASLEIFAPAQKSAA